MELKLAIPADFTAVLMETVASRASAEKPSTTRHERTTYFDTSDEALARAGLSLRVRCADGRHIQTVKANRSNGAAADRDEFEWPLETDKPDLQLAARTPVAGHLPSEQALEPVVETDIRRIIHIVRLDGDTVVEAALDEGTIAAGKAARPVRELELELKQGTPAALFRWALELHATVPFTIESESKAARGYRLRHDERPAVRKATDIALDRKTRAADAFRQIVTAGLGHLLANQPAALCGDAEGVHQMRVAIRRLRTALALFAPHLEPYATARFQAELRRIGQVFGLARDWDVFCLQILPNARRDPNAATWCPLLHPLAAVEREAAHQRFTGELMAPAFTSLVLGLAAWVEQNPPPGDATLRQPITDVAPHLLDRLARKVRRRGRHAMHGSDAERHALRKSLKKLRYGIDYLQTIYPGEAVNAYLRRCKKLQKLLGDINDAVTAPGLADRLDSGTRPDLAPAVGALTRQLNGQRDEALAGLGRRWKAFRDQEPFWR
ncbi:MAG: CHAD domain-containing protein [Rhodopila sp.]